MDRRIIEDNLSKGPVRNVAHYTKIGNLAHFMPTQNIGWSSAWATPIQFLNDRFELVLGLKTIQNVVEKRNPRQNIVEQHAPQQRFDARVISILTSILENGDRSQTDAFQMSFSGNIDAHDHVMIGLK